MTALANKKDLEHKLSTLSEEHVELNEFVNKAERVANFDQLMLLKLKKRKLFLKDEMHNLKAMLYSLTTA